MLTPFASSYLGTTYGNHDTPAYAAPARATDLTNLPPAFVMVGNLDGLLDEDIDYARRLIAAGIPTDLHVLAGAPPRVRQPNARHHRRPASTADPGKLAGRTPAPRLIAQSEIDTSRTRNGIRSRDGRDRHLDTVATTESGGGRHLPTRLEPPRAVPARPSARNFLGDDAAVRVASHAHRTVRRLSTMPTAESVRDGAARRTGARSRCRARARR